MLHELGCVNLQIPKETSIVNPLSGSKIGAIVSHGHTTCGNAPCLLSPNLVILALSLSLHPRRYFHFLPGSWLRLNRTS